MPQASDYATVTTRFSYDPAHAGDLTARQDPNGSATGYAYDPATGDLLSATDGCGNKTAFLHDRVGRVSAATRPRGTLPGADAAAYTTTTTYDDAARQVRVADGLHRTTVSQYDRDGNLLSSVTTDAAGQTLRWTYYSYDAADELTQTWQSSGQLIRRIYDGAGHLACTLQSDRGTSTPTATPAGTATPIAADTPVPAGSPVPAPPRADPSVAACTTNGQATVTPTPDPAHSAVPAAPAAVEVDPRVLVTAYIYDTLGRVRQVIDPLGRATRLDYDGAGNLAVRTDSQGYQTRYDHDGAGRLTGEHRPDGSNPHTTYDADGNPAEQTDARGAKTTTSYDSFNRPVTVLDPLQRLTYYDYDLMGNRTLATDPAMNTTASIYDADNRPVQTIAADGGVAGTTYDADGNPLSRINLSRHDAGTHTATATYDTQDRLLAAADPLGGTTGYRYDSLDRVAKVTDPLRRQTGTGYDATGRLITATDPQNHRSITLLDARGNAVAQSDANGHTTRSSYDEDGELASRTLPDGAYSRYSYDLSGPLGTTTRTDFPAPGNPYNANEPASRTTTSTYDPALRVEKVTDPLGNTSTATYDAGGNRTDAVDGLGHETASLYDIAGQLASTTAVSAAGRPQILYFYDADGNLQRRQDERGNSTSYTYDPLNRPQTAQDALHPATIWSYDPGGASATMKDPQGRTTTYTYDDAGRLHGIGYSDPGTHGVAYTYYADGRRHTMADGTGTTIYGYDPLGRLADATDGARQHVGYSYDPAGNLQALTYPDGTAVRDCYDRANRLVALQDWRGRATGAAACAAPDAAATSTFGYDGYGQLAARTLPGVGTEAATYDGTGALTALQQQPASGAALSYGYLRDGQRQVRQATDPLAGAHSYGYDGRGQLATDTTGTTTTAYGYTPAQGLETIATRPAATGGGTGTGGAGGPPGPPAQATTLGYDAAEQLATLTQQAGTTTTAQTIYTFDQDGNRTVAQPSVPDAAGTPVAQGAPAVYGYDQADRLTSAGLPASGGVPGPFARYAYDGDGLRASTVVGATGAPGAGATTRFAYDRSGGLPQIIGFGAAGSATKVAYGPDGLPFEQIDAAGKVRYLLGDQQGSIRAVLSASGGTVASYRYDPFGARTAVTGSLADTPFGYAGQYTDAETGFQYLRARYYDPATAQFLTRDPLVGMTGQPYAYAGNNPLTYGDPSGRCPWCALVGAAVGAGAYLGISALTGRPITWQGVAAATVAGGITGLTFGLAGAAALGADGALTVEGLATAGGIGAAGNTAATVASVGIGEGRLPSGQQLAAAAASGFASGLTAGLASPLAGLLGEGAGTLAGRGISGMLGGAGNVAAQGADDLLDPAHSTGVSGLLLAGAEGFAGGFLGGGAGGCGCFPGDTPVDTPHGKRPIASLHVGDPVLAEDPATGRVEAEPVQAVIDDGIKPTMRVGLSDGGGLTVTTNHPFYADASAVRGQAGWVQAGDLRVGDRLRTEGGADLTVVALRYHTGSAHVYTLTVATDHTFFVGGGVPVLVHNCDESTALSNAQQGLANAQTRLRGLRAQNSAYFRSKVVGATAADEATLSGYSDSAAARAGYPQMTADVAAEADQVGHTFSADGRDNNPRGLPQLRGRFYRSHAETQMSQFRPDEPFGSTEVPCMSCRRWLRNIAISRGVTQYVSDPLGDTVFYSNGVVKRFGASGGVRVIWPGTKWDGGAVFEDYDGYTPIGR